MGTALDTLMSYLRIPLLASSGIAALCSGLLYFKQNELIYPRAFPPDARTNVPRPSQFGLTDYEELFIPTPDGESLSAFYIRPNKQHARNVTVLMFHGNAGNIGYRLPIAKVLTNELRCNVLMLQYRGYGLSSGNPNEKGLMIDAQTGLDYIRNRSELQGTQIVVYGQSIGGAVAIALASRNQKQGDVAGVVLENTFTSIRKLIPS
ncbi:bem46 protein, variant [Ascochyta clinopodiicola]|nr:bem46 protein, variant [Ascochyta clinopodiicola]